MISPVTQKVGQLPVNSSQNGKNILPRRRKGRERKPVDLVLRINTFCF
jgi:hypothetical protein